MDLHVHIAESSSKMENLLFQKMSFIYNALENGWSIKKQKDSYIFSKKHEGKKEVYSDSYLTEFITGNLVAAVDDGKKTRDN